MVDANVTYSLLEDMMVQRVADALAIPPDDIDVDKPLSDFGLDSMALLTLGEALEQRLGRKLEPTLLWYYPTIKRLTDHLLAEWRTAAQGS